MSITLIRTNSDGVVHGADNDKLTGCRKRLQTMSSTREGEMNDIVDLTCERCKEYFAKKMIRESNREESKMAKEEKKRYQRAKKQGIVSEATYEEYVMNRESEASARRDSKKDTDLPPLKADSSGSSYPSYQNYNQPAAQPEIQQNPVNPYQQPTYQPQMGNSYQQPDAGNVYPQYGQPQQTAANEPQPQFSEYQPSYEQYKSSAESNQSQERQSSAASNDDFLAQFMINKPSAQPEDQPQQVNSAVVYNDPLAAAKNTASSILNQLENDFGTSDAGKSDASSFYNSSSPLVDPSVSSASFESITNEFGTFNMPEQAVKPPVNDFSVPEVPQLNKPADSFASTENSFEEIKAVSQDNSYTNYINSFDPMNQQTPASGMFDSLTQAEAQLNSLNDDIVSSGSDIYKVNNSLDGIVPPVLDDIDSALAAAEMSLNKAAATEVKPAMDAFRSAVPPVQPAMDAFASVVPPVQPAMDTFQSAVPPVQPAMNAFQSVVPPVQPAMDTFQSAVPPMQPAMDTFQSAVPPMQPAMDTFQSAVPPVQPSMNTFQSAVPPVQPSMNTFQSAVPPVQPSVNIFKPAAQAPSQSQQMQNPVNNSQFIMPQMAPKAAYQAKAPQVSPVQNTNKTIPVLFNQAHSPTADSIEDALIALGAETAKKADTNQNSEKEEIVPNFVAYVPSSSKVLHSAPPVNDYSSAPKRTMSAREAKRAAKIDAKFRKELIDRGYSPDEIKSQRRGK